MDASEREKEIREAIAHIWSEYCKECEILGDEPNAEEFLNLTEH